MKKYIIVILIFVRIFPSYAQSCQRIVDSENFSGTNQFVSVGAGNVQILNGAAYWNNAQCSVYDYKYRFLNDTVSNNYFKIAFNVSISPNPINHGVGAILVAITADTLHFLNYDFANNFALTDQDGIGISLVSVSPTDNNMANWFFQLETKEGNTRIYGQNNIAINPAISDYYIVLEKFGTSTELKLYTDSTQVILLGQATNPINSNIDSLNVLQFGVSTAGNSSRWFTGYVDNISICDDIMSTAIGENLFDEAISMTSNLTGGEPLIINSTFTSELNYSLLDSNGKIYTKGKLNPGSNYVRVPDAIGLYILEFSDSVRRGFKKFMLIE